MGGENLRPPNTTRKRASTRRSKTGCITCKIRRLKCGEEKPSCHRCVKSGWHCDGYEHVVNLPTSKDVNVTSVKPRTPSPSLSEPSIGSVDLDEQERRYFQYFLNEVSPHLQTYDAFFWSHPPGLVLQESLTTSSVRHAIIAIGALAMSTQKSYFGTHRMDANPGFHREFALQQYQMAIQSLRHGILNLDDSEGIRTGVSCCLVLAFFDNFMGNGGFAMQHIRYARQVLANAKHTSLSNAEQPNPQDDQLANMLLRMDIQTLCALGIDEKRTYVNVEPHTANFVLPTRFYDLEEAKATRNLMMCIGYNFYYRTAHYNSTPKDAIPQEILRERDDLIQQIHILHALLNELLLDIAPDFVCHPLSRPESLKLYLTALLVRLTTSLGAPQTACDELLPHFEYLVAMSRETMEYEHVMDPGFSDGETFTFEVRTVAPLFLVATKCRDGLLRREAIHLLLCSHRREFMYDSLLAGEIGQWIMGLEEEGRDENGYIPECSRVWGENVELNLQRRSAKVTCKLNVRDPPGAWVLKERVICW